MARRPEAVGGGEPGSVPDLSGRHVLVVEDVGMNRALIEAMLAPTGAVTRAVASGAEAVEAVRLSRPDIVLMDIEMPVMDGFEAMRRLRALAPDLAVVALTAHAKPSDREAILAAGMDRYLAKPVLVDDLYAVLHEALAAR